MGTSPFRSVVAGVRLVLAFFALAVCSCAGGDDPAGVADEREGVQPPGPADGGAYVRVLGTVQDGGLPHAACDCTRCAAARQDPRRRRRIASIAICLPASGKVYLVDATPDLREQLHVLREARDAPAGEVDRAPVDGVFLTHAHVGHYLGIAFFGFEAVHSHELPIFGTPRMIAFLRGNGPWDQLVRLDNIRLVEIEPDAPVALGDGVEVTPMVVPHRDEYTDTVAFRITGPRRSLLYVPDTDRWATWTPTLIERLSGVDVAILDGTFYSPAELPGRDVRRIGHPTIETTLDLLGSRVAEGALSVFFTHLNHSNPALDPDGEARRSLRLRGFEVLAEGQRIPL